MKNVQMAANEKSKLKIVIATKNQGKVREMINAFQGLPVELVSLADLDERFQEPVEDGDTFAANSLLKAEYYQKQTGMACLMIRGWRWRLWVVLRECIPPALPGKVPVMLTITQNYSRS